MPGARIPATQKRQIGRSAIALIVLGVFPAASMWAANTSTNPDLAKLCFLGLVLGVTSSACAVGSHHLFGVSLSVTTVLVAVAETFFAFWGVFADALSSALFPYVAPAVLLPLVFIFVLFLAGRMARSPVALSVVLWAAIGLLTGASAQAIWTTANLRLPDLQGMSTIPTTRVGPNAPDIFYVVLDGYARSDVLIDLFDFDNSEFVAQLQDMGFSVPRAARANYSMTYASLTSALTMDYAVTAGSALGPGDRKAMYEVLGGANPVVETLHRAGYSYYQVESGWGGTRCGKAVDRCYPSPFLEESVWALLNRSALASLAEKTYGHSFPFTGLDRLKALPAVAEDARMDDRPVAVFAHVLLPHPPSLLTAACEIHYDPILRGMQVGAPWLGGDVVLSRRKQAYIDELTCVNTLILKFLGNISDPNDIIVITADHGTASRGQLVRRVSEWSAPEIEERLSPFIAIRLPETCGQTIDDQFEIVNSFRTVLRCAIGADLPDSLHAIS